MKIINSAVIIIGSGFGGQCAAIQLQKRGIHDFRILERRAFMGGTWSQMFAEQNKIETHTQHVIDKQVDVDLIVYSTGYDATDGVISYPVIGKGGKVIAMFPGFSFTYRKLAKKMSQNTTL